MEKSVFTGETQRAAIQGCSWQQERIRIARWEPKDKQRTRTIINEVIAILLMVSAVLPAMTACPTADITGDCRVDLEDLAILAGWWLDDCDISNDWCDQADLGPNGIVDLSDISILSSQWLLQGQKEPEGMVWIDITDPGVPGHRGFSGQMSQCETTNAQYCQFLNAALVSGDITVIGNHVYGASGLNSGEDYIDQVYYNLAGAGYTCDGATNGGAARIRYCEGVFTVESGLEDHPVTYVSWYGATAFGNYYGYRLPTEWEWQAVADYDGSYTYGCGTSIDNTLANYMGSHHPNGSTAVGAFGLFGYGLYDVEGNVWEWTSTVITSNYCVLRGGSWDFHVNFCKVSSRNLSNPYSTDDYSGFRVCQ